MKSPFSWHIVWPFVASALCLLMFWSVGAYKMDGPILQLGLNTFVEGSFGTFLAVWSFFGSLAAFFLTVGLWRLSGAGGGPALDGRLRSISDARWLTYAAVLAFLLPVLMRLFVLRGAPLTDDEGCYRFSAQLLASGRLYAPSHPVKLFFDHAFMVNDGKFYSQYPLGWPALMVPGVLLGISGYMNALYSALTVPAIRLIARRLAGNSWGWVAVALYVASPFVIFTAATELSHTSCLMALTWTTWAVLRSRDEDSPAWAHALVAASFGLAFFIRPSSSLGLGLPLLGWWGAGVLRRPAGRLPRVVSFLVPAVVLAGLFLLVNQVQNGSPFHLSYQRALAYMQDNGFRFAALTPSEVRAFRVVNFSFTNPAAAIANTATALFRVNADLFGWPMSVVFVLFAGFASRTRLAWACFACFLAVHFFVSDSGIDSFGPVHFYELTLPIVLLSVIGLSNLTERLGGLTSDTGERSRPLSRIPLFLVASLIVVTFLGYFQVRAAAVRRIADDVNAPTEAVRDARLRQALVFAARPYTPQCLSAPTRHWVRWPPLNDPDMADEIVWANHISVGDDRRLAAYFPERTAFLLLWRRDCRVAVMRLDEADPAMIPNGVIGGTGVGPFASPPAPAGANAPGFSVTPVPGTPR